MSFAIYGESDTYVFLATAETSAQALNDFMEDVKGVGVEIAHVYNVFAVNGRDEDIGLTDAVNKIIEDAIQATR